jgi:2-haloacid dehalogenase
MAPGDQSEHVDLGIASPKASVGLPAEAPLAQSDNARFAAPTHLKSQGAGMFPGTRPEWLTFDCYGTLIQWDEGLLAAVEAILEKQGATGVDAKTLIRSYDKHEHDLEQQPPFKPFRTVAAEGLRRAMEELGLSYANSDIGILASSISRMPPFPEVVDALAELKAQKFKLCIISNTEDEIIAGNLAQLGGHIDRVITAQQARSYKPSPRIFEHARRALGIGRDDLIHICASPHLDLAAARDMGFRCIWIDRGTGRKPPPNYVPDEVFPTLGPVPAFFRSLGWI